MLRSVVVRVAVAVIVVACATLVLWLLFGPQVMAASPTPAPLASGDVRTSGEGAGLVGAPFLAAGGVIVIGLMAAGLATAYVRFGRNGPKLP
ncbi:MAG: hypothetical protein ACRDF7_02800 [Candidatus Limnocylindrales bacterium]